MSGKNTESCGRCAMSSVVDTVASSNEGEAKGEGEADQADRDPFGDEAIEIDEETLRRVSPAAWAGRVTGRIDAAVQRVIYNR